MCSNYPGHNPDNPSPKHTASTPSRLWFRWWVFSSLAFSLPCTDVNIQAFQLMTNWQSNCPQVWLLGRCWLGKAVATVQSLEPWLERFLQMHRSQVRMTEWLWFWFWCQQQQHRQHYLEKCSNNPSVKNILDSFELADWSFILLMSLMTTFIH